MSYLEILHSHSSPSKTQNNSDFFLCVQSSPGVSLSSRAIMKAFQPIFPHQTNLVCCPHCPERGILEKPSTCGFQTPTEDMHPLFSYTPGNTLRCLLLSYQDCHVSHHSFRHPQYLAVLAISLEQDLMCEQRPGKR